MEEWQFKVVNISIQRNHLEQEKQMSEDKEARTQYLVRTYFQRADTNSDGMFTGTLRGTEWIEEWVDLEDARHFHTEHRTEIKYCLPKEAKFPKRNLLKSRVKQASSIKLVVERQIQIQNFFDALLGNMDKLSVKLLCQLYLLLGIFTDDEHPRLKNSKFSKTKSSPRSSLLDNSSVGNNNESDTLLRQPQSHKLSTPANPKEQNNNINLQEECDVDENNAVIVQNMQHVPYVEHSANQIKPRRKMSIEGHTQHNSFEKMHSANNKTDFMYQTSKKVDPRLLKEQPNAPAPLNRSKVGQQHKTQQNILGNNKSLELQSHGVLNVLRPDRVVTPAEASRFKTDDDIIANAQFSTSKNPIRRNHDRQQSIEAMKQRDRTCYSCIESDFSGRKDRNINKMEREFQLRNEVNTIQWCCFKN